MNQPQADKESYAELFAEQPDLARLLWALKRARGFALFFARCNIPIYREQLIAALRSDLPRPITVVEITPDETEDGVSIDARIARAASESPDDAALFVIGLEHLLPSSSPDLQWRTLQQLNWRRGALSKPARPIVFWLPEFALTALARNAPDLYDWYSGVYVFDLDQTAKRGAVRPTLDALQQRESVRWLSPDERRRWVDTLQELIEQQSEETSEHEAELLNQLGKLAREQADYQSAQKYLEHALRISESAFGSDHPNVAIRLNNLAGVLQDLGELQDARRLFERALKIDEASFGSDHPRVASELNNLALVLRDLGELQDARNFFERALKIYENAYGFKHPYIATTNNNLAMVLRDLGELQNARRLFERALKIDEASFDSDHPSVARDVNNLASVLQDLGELQDARRLFERALKIDEASFGSDHPNVAIRLNNLAGVLNDLGELQQARQLIERSLKIDERFLGENHPKTAIVRENLESLVQRMDDHRSQARG